MCGICGMLNLDYRTPVDSHALREMNGALHHRGPDSEGYFREGPVGIAMRRLSIIDLQGGTQPIGNEDGSVQVIQNGEIYNYRELRRDLVRRGHQFTTDSDTEVLVHLYEERGTGFVEELRGMFGIALWDSRNRRLVLARDRFAIKPLYYRITEASLSFSSELKSLMLQPGFSTELDLEALEMYLAFGWIPAPLTIFEEARKLPAGYVLVAEHGRVRTERFARPAPVHVEQLRKSTDEDELAAELRERLRESVRAHLVADVPVGVLLSGGIDSSALVAFSARESSTPVKTFSIGFDDAHFNELDRARLVAERYETEHHELIVRPDAAELLPVIAGVYDEPFGDNSALPTYLVSQLAAGHVKVALSGEGGDELFGGYRTYVANLLAPRVGPAAANLLPLIERLPNSPRLRRHDDRAKRFARAAALPPLERHHAWTQLFSEDARERLLAQRVEPSPDVLAVARARYAETEGADPMTRLRDVDLGGFLAEDPLVKTDRASMAHSLEVRVPFLDTAISDFAFALPAGVHVGPLGKKRLLRRALRPLLPREIIDGRKQGFSIPAASWLRGDLQPMLREALSPAAVRQQGVFRVDAVNGLIERHLSGREDLSRQLWSLLMFSLWHEHHIGSSAPPLSLAV